MFWGALAFGDFAATASDETLRTLSVLDYYAVSGMPFAFAVFVGASSIVIARTRVLWRWLAYLGAIEVALSLLAPLSTFSSETKTESSMFDLVYEIAFGGFALWILLVGIAMVSRREEPAVASAPA